MTTARFDTVSNIVNEALVELGLAVSTGVDVFGSSDPLYVQARTLLKSCGQELIDMPGREWQSLHKTHSFTAQAAVAPATYGVNALPDDLDHYLSQTGWDQSDQTPIIDATPQVWEAALASLVASIRTYARIDADRLLLYPDTAGNTITIGYSSRYWLADTATPTVLSLAAPVANTDVVFFTPLLIKRLLKLRIALAKGMAADSLLADFETSLAQESSKLGPAPVLDLAGGGSGLHFIDGRNLPTTGWGQ